MTLKVLFSARDGLWAQYERPLTQALASQSIEAQVLTEADPAEVDYIVYAPNDFLSDFGPFTKAKAVLSLWAGVEGIKIR